MHGVREKVSRENYLQEQYPQGRDVGDVRYTVTQRGAPCLVIDGFSYVARKRRGPRVYWSCRCRRQYGCQARALTNDGQLTMSHCIHNHPLQPAAEFSRIESLIEVIAADNADKTV
ncbi:unnamed protein product [Leptosia nina]|uniref:FLYWCH-type domain-containing protein n=1 Tax=Leptosia nina TaxID=320188 RepID=A0AAV1J4B1_9NEOP